MKKRVLAALLTTCLAITTLAGCGSESASTSEGSTSTDTAPAAEEQAPAAEEQVATAETEAASKYQTTYGSKMFDDVTITVELFDRSNAPEGSTITDNRWTNYVNEQMNKVGITVEFVPVPRWDEVEKMQTMVAGQTAPDITLTYTYAYAEDYFNQGGIWDLSEFIDGEDQAKNLKAYIGEDTLNIGRNADNALYGIVARRATTAKSNFFIRKDWLDALNLEVPTTTEELHDVLYKMVHENPDGRQDVCAIVWNAWNLRKTFSKLAGNEVEVNIAGTEDSTQDYYDPGMKDYYRYMNQLYNDGILNPEYYTLSEDNFKSLFVTGSVAFMEYSVNANVDVLRGSLLKTLQENEPSADVVSIEPLKNVNDGQQYSPAYASGGLIAFCPKTADEEKVEACMTYLDWMCTQEGGFTIYHGFAGEHFEWEGDVPVVKDAEYNATDKDWLRTDLFVTGNQGYFATVEDFNACTSKEAPGYESYVIANYENALKGTVDHDSVYTSPSTSDHIADLTSAKDEYSTALITCAPDDFDATWDEYMEELEKCDVQLIIQERTDYFKQ
ncbi:MAG: extracellular solute-binding protein [Lachnospiraceae bacterium]|nr:extracellular solute-binding protein [Lachnospiraceae bacterium]